MSFDLTREPMAQAAGRAGETWLRFNLVNLHTRERHIRALAEQVVEVAREATG